MMKTGKDIGIFGGLFAIILGYFIISVGFSLVKYGDYPPPRLNQEEDVPEEEPSETDKTLKLLIMIAGAACVSGGVVGLTGGCLANSRPRDARTLMITGGCIAAISIIGASASAILAAGANRAIRFANAPPGTEQEWEDGEALPY